MANTEWGRAVCEGSGRDAVPMILAVDDHHDMRENIAEVLALAGYRVSTAPNGKVALQQAHVHRPDLIVLDLIMPEMNGWQFMEALRCDPELATIPVVAVTAGQDCQADGAAVVMEKPFDSDTLLTAVSRLCDGWRERLDYLSA